MRAMFWLRVGVGAAAGLGVGAGLLAWTPPVYEASTSVLVESMGLDISMPTEAELVRATQTANDAFARLTGHPAQPPPVGWLARVEPVPGTSVLVITFAAGLPEVAQAGATAFAEAYLAARDEAARRSLDDQIAAAEARLEDVRTQLGGVTMLIAQLPPDAAELESLRAGQGMLTAEAASLSARLHELRTTPITPGRIVSAAPLPVDPVRPDRRWLALTVAAGGLAGAAVHAGLRRWSRWVRRTGDLRRHRAVAVLAEVDPSDLAGVRGPLAVGPPREDRAAQSMVIFNRLRNEIVAALAPSDHTLLVTGAAPGRASRLVAANLAAAFARADSDVVLVGAQGPLPSASPSGKGDPEPSPPSLAALFDVADIPGLADVLAGRTTLPRIVQPAARQPRLRVVTPGGWARGAGVLLQSEGARSVLRALATRIRYVVVDAPSTASGADAQSLASAADAALLVVELGRTRHDQVADAVTQLARVGTRLLGAVVVPRVTVEIASEPAAAPLVEHDTEAWVGARPAALDGPTTKLDTVPRWPLSRERPQPQSPPQPQQQSRSGAPGGSG